MSVQYPLVSAPAIRPLVWPKPTTATYDLSKRIAGLVAKLVLFGSLVSAVTMMVSISVPALLGLKSMIVVSGSMEPAIHVGDLAVIKPMTAESVQVGDLLTFSNFGVPGTTTHRVVAVKEIDGRQYFQTKGDANDSPDPNLAPADAVFGKVLWIEPRIGYLMSFGGSALGRILIIVLPLALILGLEMRDLLRPKRTRPAEGVIQGETRGASALS